jgi:tetratricopeptide (TPR) repeat protein
LGVRYVLEGSVRKAGNRVRITGQLIDTATGAHIWADRFDGALDDIFELQDRVASNVVGAIEPRLRRSEIERAARKPTESLDAYDLYLRALAEYHKFTAEGMRQALPLLRRALAIDPAYAPAAALIGLCRHLQRDHGLGGAVSDADVADSVRLARNAIAVGKDDPDVLWMAGFVLTVFAGEHARAATVIDRALALNPNSAHAWMHSGLVSCFRNQPGRAIEALQRAMRLSPLDPQGPGLARSPSLIAPQAATKRPWNGLTGRCTNTRASIPQWASGWSRALISGASTRPGRGSSGGSSCGPDGRRSQNGRRMRL